jgi:hypothetical protein
MVRQSPKNASSMLVFFYQGVRSEIFERSSVMKAQQAMLAIYVYFI